MSKLKSIAVILLLSSLVFGSLYAEDTKKEEAKTPDYQITGEAPEGFGGGYKLNFNKEKTSFIKLWGYSRLAWDFNSPNNKLTQPYFRFLIDGKKNDQFEFHSRLDYQNAFHMSKLNTSDTIARGNTYGAPTLYFARAYVTYLLNDQIKIDAGRIIQFNYRYDVLTSTNTPVGLGIAPHFVNGDFTTDLSLLHISDNQEMGPTTPPSYEAVYVGGRVGYANILAKDVKLSYGLGYHGNYKEVGERYHEIMPDITLNLPYNIYILTQSVFHDIRDGENNNKFQSYNEIGKDITDKLALDMFVDAFKEGADKSYYDLGFEAIYKVTPSISAVYSGRFQDALDKRVNFKDTQKIASKVWMDVSF